MALARRGLLALAALVASAASASAHNLLVEGRVAQGRVRVEAFYDDDSPARQARITLENADGQIVAEGKTDDKGTWNCSLPAPGKYTLKAQSSGHAARRSLVVAETLPAPPGVDSPSSKGAEANSIGLTHAMDSTSPAPTRAELTVVPWRNIAIGCGIIAVVFSAIWRMRRVPS